MRMAAENTPDASENLETLKLRYQQVLAERDRLRSARAGVTSRLGPLPASAAIVIGLAGGVAHGVDPGYLIAAAILLFVLIVFRTVYSGLSPYRILLAKKLGIQKDQPERFVGTTVDSSRQEQWLKERICQEGGIYGQLRTQQGFTLTRQPNDLQEAFDVQRWVLIVVQLWFALIILVLVAGLAFD
jgi:hypothetical protein